MPNKDKDYWHKRFTNLTDSLLNIGEDYYKDLSKEYDKAIKNINDDISKFYGRFANNNQITYEQSKKMLTNDELKSFKMDIGNYIDGYKDLKDKDKNWMTQLENASLAYRISRLKMIQLQIQQHVEMLTVKYSEGLTKTLSEIFTEGFYNTGYEIAIGSGIATSFSRFDQKALDIVISKPWAADGRTFSSRIWANQDLLINNLQTILTQGFIRGDSIDIMTNNLQNKMNTSRFNAQRVIRTESAYVTNESLAQGFKNSGVDEYELDAVLDFRTSQICQDIDGKVFKLTERNPGVNYPPLHPNCRTSAVPYFEDEVGERFARDSEGKGIYISKDIKYKEWKEKYVNENTK